MHIRDCPEDGSDRVPDEALSLFRAAASGIVALYCYAPQFFLGPSPKEQFDLENVFADLIVDGSYDAVTTILLHHLPNIKTFSFVTDVGAQDYRCLNQIMRLIAAGYQDPAIAPRLPLQNLRTAATICANTRGCNDVSWACYFSCIPSLRDFAAWAMGSQDVSINGQDHLQASATTAPVSNVEQLFFDRCQFDTDSLDTMLPLIKNLRKFTYGAGGSTVAYSFFEPRKVIKALGKYAGDSLEELVLEEEYPDYIKDEDDIPSVSLQNFRVLRVLNCELRCLVTPEDVDSRIGEADANGSHNQDLTRSWVIDPRDCLPQSLEKLYLHGVFGQDEWEEIGQIFATSNPATPKLTLDGIHIRNLPRSRHSRDASVPIGTAEKPPDMYTHPLSQMMSFA